MAAPYFTKEEQQYRDQETKSLISASAKGFETFANPVAANAFFTANPPEKDTLFVYTDPGESKAEFYRRASDNTTQLLKPESLSAGDLADPAPENSGKPVDAAKVVSYGRSEYLSKRPYVRVNTELSLLDYHGNYSGAGYVDSRSQNTPYPLDVPKLKEGAVVTMLEGWKAVGTNSFAGVTKAFSQSIADREVGELINVSFVMRKNGLGVNTTDTGLRIGANLIPVAVANSETTITDLADGWKFYKTRHVITASDITQANINRFRLAFFASATPATDKLEFAGLRIGFNDDTFFNAIDAVAQELRKEIPTVEKGKGKIILDGTPPLSFIGNNTVPFDSQNILTAGTVTDFAGDPKPLTVLDPRTPVYQGVGWEATGFSAWNGFRYTFIGETLSGRGLAEGDKLTIIFYRRIYNPGPSNPDTAFYIGTNKINIQTGYAVLIETLSNGWERVTVSHFITASDVTQDTINKFDYRIYGNGTSGNLASQELAMTTPVVYSGDLNLYSFYADQSNFWIDNKVELLTTRQRRLQGKTLGIAGDSISAYGWFQPQLVRLLKTKTLVQNAVPGRQMKFMGQDFTTAEIESMDFAFVFGGTNDYGGNKPLGTIADAKEVDTFYGNIKLVIDRFLSFNPSLKLMFFTPLNRGAFSTQPVPPAANGAGATLRQYADAIIETCALYSIPVEDLLSIAGLNSYNFDDLTIDGLHITQEYHITKLAYLLANALEKL